jgi:hypothetical protein
MPPSDYHKYLLMRDHTKATEIKIILYRTIRPIAGCGFEYPFPVRVISGIKKPEQVRFFYFNKEKLELEYSANRDQS